MADIELVIKIPEELYKNKKGYLTTMDAHIICDAVANGTPLPKGHGRLKDVDEIINHGISQGWCEWYDEMKYAPTIIEADKGETKE